MNPLGTPQEVRLAGMVSRYATPLAIILVSLGIVLSQPRSPVREITIGLLAFGIVFNMGASHWLGAHPGDAWLIKLRVWVNLAANSVMVYYLGGYWTPIWLLMVLTPVATAIYSTRNSTLAISAVVCCILLAIHATRRLNGPLDWGQQFAQAAFIVLLSLMANELSLLAKSANS